ncbi:MAG: serine--tRNA ligase, partial [Nitrososphaerota archaeon]
MLDIKLMRQNPDIFRHGLRRRGIDPSIVDRCIAMDEERRSLITRVQELRHRRTELAEEIGRAKKSGIDTSGMMRSVAEISREIEHLETRLEEVETELRSTLFKLPNIPHESVPEGEGEENNVVLRTWGRPLKEDWMKDHVDILMGMGLLDVEAAGKVAGARFYYIFEDIVLLNYALINYALDFLSSRGFRLVQPPYMLRREIMEGVISLEDFESMIYKIEGEDLYLIGTAEHPIAGLHVDSILDGRMLPLRYAGVSPCFRKEAGAHGKDTKGIFRVHQFEKVEQFVFCKPEQSWNEHELLIRNAEEIYRGLGLPYRVVNICIGELGPIAAKKYDLEVWMPAQERYREVVSCSNCTD